MKKSLVENKPIFATRKLQNTDDLIKQNLTILPELQDLIPPLTADEFEQLRANIKQYGCRDSLKVWLTTQGKVDGTDDDTLINVLVDGHNRHAICRAESISFTIQLIDFPGLPEVRVWMVDNQIGRRNLTREQMSYLIGSKYNALKQTFFESSPVNPTSRKRTNLAIQLGREHNIDARSVRNEGTVAVGVDKLGATLKKDYLAGKTTFRKGELMTLGQDQSIPDASIDSEDAFWKLMRHETSSILPNQIEDTPSAQVAAPSTPLGKSGKTTRQQVVAVEQVASTPAVATQSIATQLRQVADDFEKGSLTRQALMSYLQELITQVNQWNLWFLAKVCTLILYTKLSKD